MEKGYNATKLVKGINFTDLIAAAMLNFHLFPFTFLVLTYVFSYLKKDLVLTCIFSYAKEDLVFGVTVSIVLEISFLLTY
uniref:Putative ovule protein n=1 Tax=Solanum chacoense TaxID=4108 RepID=A0A0V0I651_SOLCH